MDGLTPEHLEGYADVMSAKTKTLVRELIEPLRREKHQLEDLSKAMPGDASQVELHLGPAVFTIEDPDPERLMDLIEERKEVLDRRLELYEEKADHFQRNHTSALNKLHEVKQNGARRVEAVDEP